MTTRADLLALADRVEREEPGLAMNKEILRVLGFTWRGLAYWSADDKTMWTKPVDFTTSLDAAASLIGPTWMATITDEDDDGWAVMLCHPLLSDVFAHAPTEPRARTAAALRARAMENSDEG